MIRPRPSVRRPPLAGVAPARRGALRAAAPLLVALLVPFVVPISTASAAPPQEPATPVAEPEAEETGETTRAAGPWAPDRVEPGSVEAIRELTTAPEYLPASVAYVPESATVPSPSEVLGHVVGAEGELSGVAEIHGYLRRLAAASERVRLRTVGTSEEGREIVLLLVSSRDNLANLERVAEINRALADPRATDREAMEAMVDEGRVVYHLVGGLHSTETGSPEMLMELAYRLAVSERPEIREIRERVVVAITPVAEPDGRDRVVEWYERHLRGRDLEWEEVREIGSPPYWGHYAFHDNNRDGMQRTLALTRAVHDVFHELRPQVLHDLHESLPLLYISTGHGPYSTAIDPVTINQWSRFAHHEAAQLQSQGLPGVWLWGFWDGWWPGYLVSVANNHHAVGRFYETFGNSHPGTFERDLSDVEFVGQPVTDVEWYRPWPPEETVTWSLRDNTNYMQAGVLAALGHAARQRGELLRSVWIKARRSLEKGRSEPPYAWIFPPQQDDPARLAYLVNQLRAHGIEVSRLVEPSDLEDATEEGEAGQNEAPEESAGGEDATEEGGEAAAGDGDAERRWPMGSYAVRMDQPLRDLAVTFLGVQEFPADEPHPPYDDVAWTWPLLYGVEGERVDDPAVLAEPMVPVTGAVAPGGGVSGYGEDIYLLADRGQTSLLAARVMLEGWQVDAVEEPFTLNGVDYPAGSWIVQAPKDVVEDVAGRFGLHLDAALTMPRAPAHVVDLPRVGVVHTWTSTQDAGWVRYTLDRQGFPYELVSPDDLRRGGLAGRFDVLVIPNLRGDFARMVHGIDPAWGPLAYTATPDYPSHGTPNASPDVTGGMGLEGLLELQRFAAGGGLVVAVGNAGTLAVEGGLVRRVEREGPSGLRSPGSELAARVLRPEHPLVYGYPVRTSVFRGHGPLYAVPDRLRDRVVVQFGDRVEREEEPPPERRAVLGLEEDRIEVEELDADPVPMGEEALDEETVEEMQVVDLEEGEEDLGMAAGDGEADAASEAEPEPRDLVLSGWVSSQEALAGEAAVLDLPSGEGRVILFAFNPLHRYLNHSDFRFLFNALLHWNDLP